MRIPRSPSWVGALLILLLIMSRAAAASTVLLRSSGPTTPEVAPIQTYAGETAVIVLPVKAGESLTVVLLLDGLNATDLESAGKALSDLYGSLNGRPMRLALLQNGAISVQGPFASRARLKSTFEKIQLSTDNPAPISPALVYDSLVSSVTQWGSNWSRVLLIANLPKLEPAVKDYAAAILLRAFCTQHLRVSLLQPDGKSDDWMSFFESTGGTIITGDVREYAHVSKEASQSLFQVDWMPAVLPSGFVISHSVVSDLFGQILFKVSEIAVTDGLTLPTIGQYAGLQASLTDATKLLEKEVLSEADAQRIREDLRAALEVNPLEPGALLAASAYNEKQKDFAAAARFRKSLVDVQPLASTAFVGLGHELLLAADYDKAEEALKHAVDLDVMTPAIAEDLARVRLAKKDDKGAIPFLQEALRGDAKRQDLWFLQAHAAGGVANSPLAIQSFEQGLALGGVHVSESGSLLKLYLDTKQVAKAQELEKTFTSSLPPDPAIRTEFAGILDDLRQSPAARVAWKRVLEVQPASERANTRIARLLLESGDARASERAADEGLALVPRSAGLYIVRADALEKQGRMYEARDALEQGADAVADPELLSRLATVQDSYGGSAAGSYAKFVDVLSPASPLRLPALERGFTVSVRDGDSKSAEAFAEKLETAGHPEFRHSLSAEHKEVDSTLVAGGLDALAFVAHSKEGAPPERFFVEYCRALIERVCSGPACTDKGYTEEIDEHFQRVAALEAMGKRNGNSVIVTLSLNGKVERRDAEKALNLLGVKMQVTNGQIELDRGEKKSQVKKQETTSALAVDELGIQEALQAGKPYKLEIRDEPAAIFPSEKVWRESLFSSGGGAGGFATALLHNPKMARLYVGLSSLDRRTVAALLSAVNIKTLADRDADLIYNYAPAFALQGTHAAVPGGARAEPIWASLAGADPAQPGPFFAALLRQADGRLLAFFFTLSQLDRPHQAFFTSNASRTSQFYKFFSETEEMRHGASTMIGNSAFMEFLRSIPLDAEGHVNFPGSAEVWLVAKGRSTSATQTAKMLNKMAKTVAPGVEDEILLRLVQTHYKGKLIRQTELANFLAVARIDAHRSKPLDEQSALILAQNYSDFFSTYAYLTDITAIGSAEYSQFFAALQAIRSHPALEANLELGQLHSLVEWICLLARRRAITPDDAAKLFRFVGDGFAAANGPAAYTAASLDSVRAILTYCRPVEQASSADEQIRRCLFGLGTQQQSHRSAEYQRVLEMQKVPSVEALLTIYDRAKALSSDGGKNLAAIQKAASALPVVELPKNNKLVGKDKEVITEYEPAPILKIVGQLTGKVAKNKSNPRDVEKLSQDLFGELQPQVTLALAGQIYAYFLRPTDLLVSDDPLLLRKHHYFGLSSGAEHFEQLPESEFDQDSSGSGSNFVGGFGQFSLAAGTAASAGWKTAGPAGEAPIAAQIAAIRSATWDLLEESDQRLVSLRCTLAREWIEESASHADAFQALSEETMGLLSLSRRADLLSAIETQDWRRAWDSVTLPDLFALGGKFLARFQTDPWPSPTLASLRQAASTNEGSRLNILGAIPYHSFGCNHPHLLQDAPYEEYERHLFPGELAERVAEFKLFLVYLADSVGVEPSALSSVAEPLAAKAFRNAKMMDTRDWRAVAAAFSSIASADLKEALQQ